MAELTSACVEGEVSCSVASAALYYGSWLLLLIVPSCWACFEHVAPIAGYCNCYVYLVFEAAWCHWSAGVMTSDSVVLG